LVTAAPREWRRHRSRYGGWPRSGRISLRIEGQRARCCKPLVARRKLLVADQGVLGADEIVLRLVDRERVLGGAKPLLQFLQAARQIARGAPRGERLRVLGFRQIGIGDRVGEHRRLAAS